MKVPQETKTQVYELTCLFDPKYSEAELEQAATDVGELTEKNKGQIKEVERWGKKDLAYTIKYSGNKFEQAFFVHYLLTADTDQINQIREAISLHEPVVRHLLVKHN